MIFTLEALQAKEGDCLLLYFGTNNNPQVILIDGGTRGVYNKHLKPRLKEVKEALSPDDPLPLSMVMVSHIDGDHITGVIDLVTDIDKAVSANKTPAYDVQDMWFNSFDDIVGNLQIPVVSSLPTGAASADISNIQALAGLTISHETEAVIASTGQGRHLRNLATTHTIPVNQLFKPIGKGKVRMVMGGTSQSVVDWDGLKITVVHPNLTRLNELQKKWDKDLKKALEEGDDSVILASLANADTSPYNLSSIVCLVEYKKKKILFTGDARSDDIMAGLKESNLLNKQGKLQVDVLKVPHHGSERNMTDEFLEKITARHYVISADGKHGNPDQPALDKIAAVNKDKEGVTLHLTNKAGVKGLTARITKFLAKLKKDKNKMKVKFIDDSNPTLVLNLLDDLQF